MKWRNCIPPAVALLVAATWLGLQHRSISALEHANTRLRQGIAAGRGADSGSAPVPATAGPLGSPAQAPGRIDWRNLAAQHADMQGGLLGDLHAQMRSERFLQRLAFRLIGELGIKDAGDAMGGIVSVAQTPEEKTAMLVALRENLATLADATTRDGVARRAVLGLCGSMIIGTLRCISNGWGHTGQRVWIAITGRSELRVPVIWCGFFIGRHDDYERWM